MAFNSWRSQKAEEYAAYVREMMLRAKPVGGEVRRTWGERLEAFVRERFEGMEIHYRKPGLATRMFAAEVACPKEDKQDLLALLEEMDADWIELAGEGAKSGASLTYIDRLDALWEFAMNLESGFVTGLVKLRSTNFVEATPAPERPQGQRSGPDGRPGYGQGDRGRPYGSGDRGGRPGSGERPRSGPGERGRPGPGGRGPRRDAPPGGSGPGRPR